MKIHSIILIIALSLLSLSTSAQNHQEIESPTADVLSLNSTGSSATVLNFFNTNAAPTGGSDKRAYISTNGNVLNFGLSNNNTGGRIEFFGQGTRRMTMNADGRFGIGNIIPTQQLDVDGQARIRNLPAGADTDSYVTADASGNLRTVMAPSSDCNQGTEITSLPYTINSSGHYYITQDLSTTGDGIVINAPNVILNLNGYTLTGDFDVDPSGSIDDGIFLNKGGDYASIYNGFITNFYDPFQISGSTTDTLKNVQITQVHVSNSRNGFRYDDVEDLVFKDCTSRNNDASGFHRISAADRAQYITFDNCRAYENFFSGFSLGEYNTLINCRSYKNGTGYSGDGQNVIVNCKAHNNKLSGFAFDGSDGDKNTFRDNTAINNDAYGFRFGSGSINHLIGNSTANNGLGAITNAPAAQYLINNFLF